MPQTSQAYLIVDCGAGAVGPDAMVGAIRRSQAASVLLQSPAGFVASQPALAHLVQAAQSTGCAALIAGDVQLALDLGADGLHLGHDEDLSRAEQAYGAARASLGAGRIVGVSAGLSRHNAMVLAELGADYIALGGEAGDDVAEQLAMVTWWAEMFSVPCVAWNVADRERAALLVAAGADFVASDPLIGLEPAVALLAGLGKFNEASR